MQLNRNRPPPSDSHVCHVSTVANPGGAKERPYQILNRLINWWYIQSPQTSTEGLSDQKSTSLSLSLVSSVSSSAPPQSDIRPLLGKIWSLCAPDTLLLVFATVFMV
jgi:hypothetical protein